MNTLIIYATKHGASKKCAELVAQKLEGKTELLNIKEGPAPDLSKYDKVILGGSIYAGRVPKQLTDFCMKNVGVLKEKKLGLYICCMNHNEGEKQLIGAFPQGLQDSAIVMKNLGGEFKFKEMNFFERMITKMVSKAQAKKDPSNAVDMSKDLSKILEDNINDMAIAMNKA